ncbi:MAG: mltG [Sphingobacteriaceae bacterium]|jgi:UPF0755 protein|nr:mltG [Sphingobacteriaceae bacterium]
MAEKQTKKSKLKPVIIIAAVIGIGALAFLYNYYQKYFAPNVTDTREYLYIHTGSGFSAVFDSLKAQGSLKNPETFEWAAEKMNYTSKVKPGRYRLKKNMANRALINMLKSGTQEPVKLKFQNIRLKEDFAKYVSAQLEPDSSAIISLLDSSAFVSKYGFTTDNVYTMFIPNSYEMYWNTSAEKFFTRMYDEYQKFWTPARKSKAEAVNLTPSQVTILASIVDSEALHNDEMPTIAGLYLNRYKRGIKLEADPTVIFANNDFTIRRVLNRHLRKESPYNTYIHTGLPPGPIMMPSISAIDAVLNHKTHNYIYMCAKEDFSGYHNFASNLSEHLANARRFQQALNKRNIKK